MSSSPLQTPTTARPSQAPSAAACRLVERLRDPAGDRVASPRAAALEAARELHAWALEQPQTWRPSDAGGDLEQGWRAWREAHGWRGACARLVDDIRRALAALDAAPRTLLVAETRAWIAADESRLVNPELVAAHALEGLQPRDWVLVHGYSELCLAALIAARDAGLAPRVIVSELAADASGKRLARELVAHGIPVRLVWDLAALAALEQADQVWFGAEAVGAGVHVSHVGSSLLLERARQAEVPTRVLATRSDLVPGGEAVLPAWGEAETDGLWCFAPEGVELRAQPFELVDADRADHWITEVGLEPFGDFCLRGLRAEAAAPLIRL